MNKAQDIIEKVKRYQFWILCGVVSLIGIGSWWVATSGLAETYTKNKSKIESEAGKIGAVQAIVDHPNERWNEQISELVKKDREEVAKAWRRLYLEQEGKVYVWPEDIFGGDFVAAVKPLAASLRATGAPSGELTSGQRRLYQAEVLRQFQDLAKLLDADYVDPNQATSGLGGRGYGAPTATGIVPGQQTRKVVWLGQEELQQPYVWEQPPTTLGVLYAQEEIWVIRAICNAIAEANEDSAGRHDAAVRDILDMKVGYEAAEEFPGGMNEPGRITKITAPAAAVGGGYGAGGGGYGGAEGGSSGGGYGAPGGGPPGDTGAGIEGGGLSGGGLTRPQRPDRKAAGAQSGYGGVGGEGATAAVVSDDPNVYLNDWRYVKGDGTPLLAADLANPPFYEYRLMPWRVTMTVDQSKWDELLVMFRNTDLPLEIRQVRLNPITDSGSAGGYGSQQGIPGGGGAYGGGAGGGGYGGPSRGGYGASDSGPGAAMFGGSAEPIQETATLELRGFAYLLNPPDLEKIGKEGMTTALDAGSAAMEMAPAAMAAPAAAPVDPADPFGSPQVIAPAPSAPPGGAGYGGGGR